MGLKTITEVIQIIIYLRLLSILGDNLKTQTENESEIVSKEHKNDKKARRDFEKQYIEAVSKLRYGVDNIYDVHQMPNWRFNQLCNEARRVWNDDDLYENAVFHLDIDVTRVSQENAQHIYEATVLAMKDLYSTGTISHFEYCGIENMAWEVCDGVSR